MSFQGFQQVQKQSQSLVLAPQLRNSLKILQVPAVELRTSILEELQTNPLLEEMPIDSISVEEQKDGTSETPVADQSEELSFSSEDYSVLDKISEDMREQFSQENSGQAHTTEDEERRDHFMNSLTQDISLQQHLIEQAELSHSTQAEREALVYLIGNLDDNGYLTESLSNIALNSHIPYTVVQRAISTLKSFDPAGIGTEDLQDCLYTQLVLRKRGNSLAAKIIREQFKLLVRRRVPDLCRKTNSTAEEVQVAIEEIATLEPAPGKRFSPDSNAVIEPDVTIHKDEYREWIITLNSDYIPRLRISSAYKDLLAKGELSKQDKDFMLERMRSGKFLINSIEQRQQTIERITREILSFQMEFFEEGAAKLRPLTMNAIAQTVGVHETTVSRAIANKYIRTPHGVFAFKHFFTPGFTASNGEALSNKTIKDMIAHLIEHENQMKPYSDQGIVKLLQEKEIKIARRTVAKYREELGILPTNLRRRYE
jgi:RNA polymerase sigma-54 factor